MNTVSDSTPTVNPVSASPATPANVDDKDANGETLPQAIVEKNDTLIGEIVGMIRDKYADEGKRNFAIGARILKHARWQKKGFPNFCKLDLDNLLSRIRDEVRVFVAISPKSIKTGEWLRCHVLKQAVSDTAGPDVAGSISFFEYRSTYGTALNFSASDLHGDLKPGWLDFYKGIAHRRSQTNGHVSSETFAKLFAEHGAKLAQAKLQAQNPEEAARKIATAEVKAKAAAKAKSVKDITASIDGGLSSGHVNADDALAILESVATHHGLPLPQAVGFDPATCTADDAKSAVAVMFAAGKYAEMVALRDELDRVIAKVDAMRAKSVSGKVAAA